MRDRVRVMTTAPIFETVQAPAFTRRQWGALLAITALGALVRIQLQIDRPFVGDEIGTLIHIQRSYFELFTKVEIWLTMNYFLIAEKFLTETLGQTKAALVALPLLAGVAIIPLTSVLARMLMSASASLAAGLLAALNPYLVYQSVNIRSYSLLAALTLAVVLLFLHWSLRPGYARGASCAIAAFFLIVFHVNGVYPVAALGIVGFAALLRESLEQRTLTGSAYEAAMGRGRIWASLGMPMALCTTSACAMYIHLLPQLAEHGVRFHDVAPTGLHYSSAVWSEFFAGGFWGWPTAALLALAAYTAIRRSNGICLLLVLVSLAPVFLSVQGVSHFPWGYSRYLIFTLPLLIVIVSWGLASLPIVAERPRLATGPGTRTGSHLDPEPRDGVRGQARLPLGRGSSFPGILDHEPKPRHRLGPGHRPQLGSFVHGRARHPPGAPREGFDEGRRNHRSSLTEQDRPARTGCDARVRRRHEIRKDHGPRVRTHAL